LDLAQVVTTQMAALTQYNMITPWLSFCRSIHVSFAFAPGVGGREGVSEELWNFGSGGGCGRDGWGELVDHIILIHVKCVLLML